MILSHDLDRYHTDPSGTYTKVTAKVIGAASEGASSTLQEDYHQVRIFCWMGSCDSVLKLSIQSMTLDEATKLALQILKQVMEEKASSTNVEVAVVPIATNKFEILSAEQIEPIIAQLSDGTV